MSYEQAKEKYAAIGIDTEKAISKLKDVQIALHCWQGDDVRGFDTDPNKPLTGGIQTTGNYPGRARTPEELMADIDEVLKLIPGKAKMNLHASYAIFDDENGGWVDRDKLEPKHFKKWVDFCKERGLGCDFNPTFFSHPKCDPLTLASPNEETRKFWIEHGKACIRISQYLAEELGQTCVMNIWTGDGFKDVPADRKGPRDRYKDSIEQILSEPFDFNKVKPCVESKAEYYNDPVCRCGYMQGKQTVNYVMKVEQMYDLYCRHVPREKEADKPQKHQKPQKHKKR